MIKVTGLDQTLRNLTNIVVDIDDAIDKGVKATAWQVRNSAVKSIQQVSPGQVVTRTRQNGSGSYEHVASQKGDAPNTDTGALVKSVAVEPGGDGVAFVGSDLKYAAYLEFGTRQMDARPWLNPALQRNIVNLEANITKAVERQINEL